MKSEALPLKGILSEGVRIEYLKDGSVRITDVYTGSTFPGPTEMEVTFEIGQADVYRYRDLRAPRMRARFSFPDINPEESIEISGVTVVNIVQNVKVNGDG